MVCGAINCLTSDMTRCMTHCMTRCLTRCAIKHMTTIQASAAAPGSASRAPQPRCDAAPGDRTMTDLSAEFKALAHYRPTH